MVIVCVCVCGGGVSQTNFPVKFKAMLLVMAVWWLTLLRPALMSAPVHTCHPGHEREYVNDVDDVQKQTE